MENIVHKYVSTGNQKHAWVKFKMSYMEFSSIQSRTQYTTYRSSEWVGSSKQQDKNCIYRH